MTGVLCVWVADLTESSEQWYEQEYIPEMLSRYPGSALLAETIETPLDKEFEGVGTRDAAFKSLAVYEIADVQKVMDATYNKNNHPMMNGSVVGTRVDVRPYELIKSWQSDDWSGDAEDIASILFWEWQPHTGFEEQVTEYFEREMSPLLCQASQILRMRWFKIRNATVLEGDSYHTCRSEDLHTYMCLIEMDCEDWPWSEVLAMNDLPGWEDYFEEQNRVKWQASQYMVKRSFRGAKVEGSDV